MTPPPGLEPVFQPDLGANHEGARPKRSDEFMSVPTLSRQARLVVADLNLPISGSRIRQLVRQFIRDGRADVDFRTWFVAYADPTGETAVRNVMRGA